MQPAASKPTGTFSIYTVGESFEVRRRPNGSFRHFNLQEAVQDVVRRPSATESDEMKL